MERAKWNSQLGFLMAAVGSAVGLGNIWRFSYMTYENGGGAFLVPYFVALLTTGIPLMILEYGLGHKKHGSSVLSFAKIGRRYEWLGWWMPTFVMFGIMLYYSAIIGWCMNYLIYSFNLGWGAETQSFFLNNHLGISSGVTPLGGVQPKIMAATLAGWLLSWYICYSGVAHGIEKACKVFMPLLFFLTMVLVFWGITLDGAGEGIKWYLTPDWSKIMDWKVWMAAYSQIFFTLSLGFGIMITYASYLPARSDLTKNAIFTSLTNCLYSFFAGFAVFSVLGYMAQQKGLSVGEVVKAGPTLAFIVYPEAISRLPFFNNLFGIIFFLALTIAGLSSGISLIEAMASALIDKFAWDRKKTVTVLCAAGALGSILFTTGAGLHWLDILDHYLSQYGLVLAGLLECIVVGWVMKAHVLRRHINIISEWKLNKVWDFLIRFWTPGLLLFMLYNQFKEELAANYGGYDSAALLYIGVGWIGGTILAAVVLSLLSWEKSKLKYKHKPEEDELLV